MTARILLSTTFLLATALSGCATASGGSQSNYQQDLDRLREDCTAREGILAPSGGPSTGRAQTDYVCQIRGGASRLTN